MRHYYAALVHVDEELERLSCSGTAMQRIITSLAQVLLDGRQELLSPERRRRNRIGAVQLGVAKPAHGQQQSGSAADPLPLVEHAQLRQHKLEWSFQSHISGPEPPATQLSDLVGRFALNVRLQFVPV